MKIISGKYLCFAIFMACYSFNASARMVEEVVATSKVEIKEGVPEKSGPIPADQIFTSWDVWSPVLSSNGKYIAFMRLMDDSYYLSISSVEEKKVISVYNFGSHKPKAYKWKGKKLIVEIKHLIYEVALNNSSPRLLLGAMEKRKELGRLYGLRWKLLSSMESNPESIIVYGRQGESSKTYEYNIYTGDLTVLHNINRAPDSVWHYDTLGHLKVITTVKDGRLDFLEFKRGRPRLVEKFKFSNSVPYLSKGQGELSTRMRYAALGEKDGSIYIAHNLDSDRFKLYEYDLNSAKFGDILFESDKYDIGGVNSGTHVYIDSKNKILGVSTLTQKKTDTWFDKKFIDTQKTIDKKYPGGENRIIKYTDDASVVIFSHDDGTRGKEYIYNAKTDEYSLFFDKSLGLDGFEVPVRKPVVYTSRDGQEHDAYLALPAGHKSGPLPMIIIPYSGRVGRYYYGFSTWQNYFASRGYAVLRINHRGVSGYGQKYYISGIENSLSKLTNDIADAATWAIDNGLADKNNMFVFGVREGGNAALLSSIRNSGLFKAAVVVDAPINLVNEVKDYKKYDMDNALEYYALAVEDKKWKSKLKAMSPAYRMAEIDPPTLFIYGDKTTFTSDKKLKKLIDKSGKTESHFSSIFIKDEKDTLKKNTNKIYAAKSAVTYFNDHLVK